MLRLRAQLIGDFLVKDIFDHLLIFQNTESLSEI